MTNCQEDCLLKKQPEMELDYVIQLGAALYCSIGRNWNKVNKNN